MGRPRRTSRQNYPPRRRVTDTNDDQVADAASRVAGTAKARTGEAAGHRVSAATSQLSDATEAPLTGTADDRAADAATNGPTFHVVLVHPEIPPNTGNVIRQCAVTGAMLHLVEPVYFDLSDKRLRRAGLDYHEFTDVQRHASWAHLAGHPSFRPDRCFAFDVGGQHHHTTISYRHGDWLVFGNEQRGLPESILDVIAPTQQVRIPMLPDRRSLNLATSVGIGLFEAWRQIGHPGAV